jgi:hypothetical protein
VWKLEKYHAKTGQQQYEVDNRQDVKHPEGAEHPVDKESCQIQPEHAENVQRTDTPMQVRAFVQREYAGPENK